MVVYTSLCCWYANVNVSLVNKSFYKIMVDFYKVVTKYNDTTVYNGDVSYTNV